MKKSVVVAGVPCGLVRWRQIINGYYHAHYPDVQHRELDDFEKKSIFLINFNQNVNNRSTKKKSTTLSVC